MQSVLSTILVSSLLISISNADAVEASKIDKVEVSDVESQYSVKSELEEGDALQQSINFGFSNTTGNTDTLNMNGKYVLSFTTVGYDNQKLKVGFDMSAFVNKNDGNTSNEEYTANLGLEQYITEDWLGYGAVNWLSNSEFKNLDSKLSIGVGIGKELFSAGQHSLKAKIGVAYNIEQYADETPEAKFTSVNEYIEYTNMLNKTSTLFVKLGAMQNVEDFENDYEVLGVIGLNFSVAENISVTLEEEVRYDKIHPGTKEEKDTKTIVRVGYNF
jgi:putative salt-induced outer membrane protein YdiY